MDNIGESTIWTTLSGCSRPRVGVEVKAGISASPKTLVGSRASPILDVYNNSLLLQHR